MPALQKLSVQITLYAVIYQVGIDLDGDFLVCDGGIGKAHRFQVAEIGWAAIFRLAKMVDKFLSRVQ